MQTIQTTAHTSEDGTLVLRVPTSLPSSDVDVTVVIAPAGNSAEQRWPEGFIEATAGAWEGEMAEDDDSGAAQVAPETALLSETALLDWERPEEDEAWSHLQPAK